MPGQVEDSDIVRVTAGMSFGGADVLNTFHIQYQGSAPIADANFKVDVVGQLDDAYKELDEEFNELLLFETVEFFNVTQDRPMGFQAWSTLTAGTNVSNSMPTQCAPLILFGTETAASQGRKYLPPLAEDAMGTAGNIDADVLVKIAAWAARILSNVVFADGVGVFGAWNKLLTRFSPFINAAVDDIIRTQRRRVRGVGS